MPQPGDARSLRVLRLCSVFEAPPAALAGRGASYDPVGGMQSHTACLTRALDARGVRQDVVTTRPPGSPRRQRVATRAVVHRLGLPLPWLRQLYGVPALRLLQRLASRADVLHAHLGEDLAVAPLALAAARRHGVPLVLTLHMSLRHTLAGGSPRARALRALGGRLEAFGVASADAVIALTPRLRHLLLDAGVPAERMQVVPSGVALGAADAPADGRPAVQPDPLAAIPRPRVVYVGRLTRQKGLRTLVDAAARLGTPGAQLVLVGDGGERRPLERSLRRHGLDGRAHLLGFRPHEEIPALLRSADVLVLPSLYEELGSVLLEGMQAGVPIVASRTGGIPYAVGAAGVLVPPGDAAALAAALDGVLADRRLARRLTALGRERVRRFDWERLADRVLDVYRTVAPQPATVEPPPLPLAPAPSREAAQP